MPPLRSDGQPDSAALWRWLWASIRPYLGYILIAVGGILLLVGYLGVSREVIVARQIPYLVSGGLVGLAAVTLGGRLPQRSCSCCPAARASTGRIARSSATSLRAAASRSKRLSARACTPARSVSRCTPAFDALGD